MYPHSDHYDGRRFKNALPQRQWGLKHMLRWIATRRVLQWEELGVVKAPKPAMRVGRGKMVITFINHMTFLIQTNGLNILTDPVWSAHAGPFGRFGPKRQAAPGLSLNDLPPLDLVLISHNHYDHMDLSALKTISHTHHPVFLVPLGNARHLKFIHGASVREVDWWQKLSPLPNLTITAVPARHFASRTPFDRDRALWCGYVVNSGGKKVYFAGDTGWGPHFKAISKKYPRIDAALIPAGAYLPPWIMHDIHLNPDEAVKAFRETGARRGVACHFGTFQLGDDAPQQCVAGLRTALGKYRINPRRFLIGRNGLRLEI